MYGGAASGKSRYAEDLLCALSGEGPRIYLATMEAMDEESRARVRRHRALRQNKGFSTLECPRDLDGLTIPVGSSVLLEDLGNLWANELFSLRASTRMGPCSGRRRGWSGSASRPRTW